MKCNNILGLACFFVNFKLIFWGEGGGQVAFLI